MCTNVEVGTSGPPTFERIVLHCVDSDLYLRQIWDSMIKAIYNLINLIYDHRVSRGPSRPHHRTLTVERVNAQVRSTLHFAVSALLRKGPRPRRPAAAERGHQERRQARREPATARVEVLGPRRRGGAPTLERKRRNSRDGLPKRRAPLRNRRSSRGGVPKRSKATNPRSGGCPFLKPRDRIYDVSKRRHQWQTKNMHEIHQLF